jgi:LmbE family N-acetylglucosaminyl deacetylase
MNHYNKILILAPHTDDAEFGCGGTIAKFIEEGKDVHVAAFSACEQSIRPDLPKDILITEIKKASGIVGLKKENLILYDFSVRTFTYRRQEILEKLIHLRESIQPDLVIMPSLKDIHQDHKTIAEEGLRAFKFTSLWSYELPWNNLNFETTCFVILSEGQLEKKIEAISAYRSQSHRKYSDPEFLRSLAITRGVQINHQFAEVFEVLRTIHP